jgi:ets translocation variant 5
MILRFSLSFFHHLFFATKVSSWHSQYNERMFNDPLYTSLKLQCPQQPHQQQQQQASQDPGSPLHLQQQVTSPYPDSTSHHSGVADSTYHHHSHHHSSYIYRSPDITSSTEAEYTVAPLITSTHGHSLAIGQTGQIHQRRGSLQLWQFLVALLDEPAVRYGQDIYNFCNSLLWCLNFPAPVASHGPVVVWSSS